MQIHLTTTSSGAFSVGATLDPATWGWETSESSPRESIVAPVQWVDAWARAHGQPSEQQDAQWREAMMAWSRLVSDPRALRFARRPEPRQSDGPATYLADCDEQAGAASEFEEMLWIDYGIRGSDADLVGQYMPQAPRGRPGRALASWPLTHPA